MREVSSKKKGTLRVLAWGSFGLGKFIILLDHLLLTTYLLTEFVAAYITVNEW